MENWCSDNFHNLLGGFVIFTISKHLYHSCPLLCCNCWRLAVWDHVCLSALVDHRPDLRFVKLMIHAFTVKSQLHNRFQESSSIINDQCHSAQVPHLISETVVFLDSNFDCNLLASRMVNLQDFFAMIVKIVGVVYFETLVRKAGVPSRLIF